jgi:uncharacterized membrane protein
MQLDWNALGLVAAVSTGVTVALAVVFALGVLGLSQAETAREGGRGGGLGVAAAGLAFLACAAAVAYGIYLIVPQLHG